MPNKLWESWTSKDGVFIKPDRWRSYTTQDISVYCLSDGVCRASWGAATSASSSTIVLCVTKTRNGQAKSSSHSTPATSKFLTQHTSVKCVSHCIHSNWSVLPITARTAIPASFIFSSKATRTFFSPGFWKSASCFSCYFSAANHHNRLPSITITRKADSYHSRPCTSHIECPPLCL